MKTLGMIAVLSIASGAQASVLLDFRPTTTNTTGYSVGNSSFQWEVYQGFSVTDPAGWRIDRVSISGFISSGVASGNVLVEIANGTAGPALASGIVSITNTSAGTLNYVGTNLNVDLAGGANYFLRLKAASTSPFTDVGIHHGVNGPFATSRAASGFTRVQNTPVATFFEGSVIPSPAGASALALGGLVAMRRRR